MSAFGAGSKESRESWELCGAELIELCGQIDETGSGFEKIPDCHSDLDWQFLEQMEFLISMRIPLEKQVLFAVRKDFAKGDEQWLRE